MSKLDVEHTFVIDVVRMVHGSISNLTRVVPTRLVPLDRTSMPQPMDKDLRLSLYRQRHQRPEDGDDPVAVVPVEAVVVSLRRVGYPRTRRTGMATEVVVVVATPCRRPM